jgi:hypothetical protein
MEQPSRLLSLGLSLSAFLLTASVASADENTRSARRPTSVQSEYLMTLYVPLEPHIVDESPRVIIFT